jgi:glutamate-1-semialdehyde aminotransferase
LGQRALRQALVAAGESLRNQLGQATQRPTLRWVFQCFQAVHLLQVAGTKQVSNLCEEPVRNEGEFSAFLSQLVANIIYFAERPAECGLTRLTWRLPLLQSICSHRSATASATRSP